MSRSKEYTITSIFILVIIGWLVMILYTFQYSHNLPPLRFVQIPQKTRDFFKHLVEEGNDVVLKFNDKQTPDDWENKNNYGEDSKTGLKKIEDEYFIIYYTNADWARKTLKFAHEAIVPSEQLMGKYYYPKDVNNRKLAIYVAGTEKQFSDLFTMLSGRKQDVSWAAGFYIPEPSRYGNLTKGILVNSNVWSGNVQADWPKKVIWHEINHYVFFTGLNYAKSPYALTWASEGIAEYFSGGYQVRLKQLNRNQCLSYSLGVQFNDFLQNYPGGLSVYLFFERKYAVSGIKKFLEKSKEIPTAEALVASFSSGIPLLDREWHDYLKNNY